MFALAQQGICLGIMSLILDDGTALRASLAAVVTHWVGISLVLIRRRTSPTALDQGFVKFGFFLCLFVAFAYVTMLTSLRP